MAKRPTISIWTSETDSEKKAALPSIIKKTGTVVEAGVDAISKNLNDFIETFRQVAEAQDDKGKFTVDEIELSLAVNAKGGIELLGKLEGGAEASIKVKLKRKA